MPTTHPKIRDDLLYYPDEENESRRYVKDPIRGQFFRYNELQVEMMKALDGKRTVEDVKTLLEDKFDGDIPAVSISRFITRLEQNYLLDLTSYTVDDEKTRARILAYLRKRNLALRIKARDGTSLEGKLFEAATAELLEGDPCKAAVHLHAVLEVNPNNARAKQILIATHEAYFKTKAKSVSHATLVHAFDPDRILTFLNRVLGRLVFSPLGLALMVILWLSAISPAISVLSQPAMLDFGFSDFVVMFLIGEVGALFHEMAHGLACKHYGGRVTDVGWMFIYGVLPSAYCDTSDSYLFSAHRKKIVVHVAGVMASLTFIAVLYHLLALTDPTFPLWTGAALASITLLLTVPSNAICFVPFDAYYALADYLEIPNLRPRAFAYVRDRLQVRIFGVPSTSPEPTARERKVFLIYGVLAMIYTVTFMYAVYISYLLPLAVRHLGAFGLFITLLFFANLLARKVAWNLIRFIRFVIRERKVIFSGRRTIVLVAAAAAVAAILAAPWPLRVDGTLEVEPRARAEIRITEPGLVASINVRAGDRVEAGQVVAVLRSDKLVRDQRIAAEDLAIARTRLELLAKGARPEAIRLANARAHADQVGSSVAARRAQDAGKLRALQVTSDMDMSRARQEASSAGGQARVSAAEAQLVLAGNREEVVAEMEANVRRLESQVEVLAARIAQLEVKSPISGIVVTNRVEELAGSFLEQGVQLLEVHDTSQWRARILPDPGEPLDHVAIGQKVVVAAAGVPHAQTEIRIAEIMPPPDLDSSIVIYSGPITQTEWRSGMTGQARIYAPDRSIAYRLFVLPLARLIDHELPSI